MPDYGVAYLNSRHGRQHLLRSGKTTSGLNTISTSDVRRTPILVPPRDEQRRFVARVAITRAIALQLRQQLAGLDDLFAALQDRAFKGEL